MEFLKGYPYGVSKEVADFVGDKEVLGIIPDGVMLKNGEFSNFPEPTVELPIPGWVYPTTNNGQSATNWEVVRSSLQFVSVAKEELRGYISQLQNCLAGLENP